MIPTGRARDEPYQWTRAADGCFEDLLGTRVGPVLLHELADPDWLHRPANFGSLPGARAFCEDFFTYYNHEHRHAGIGLHTPASVHHGTATEVRRQHQATLHAAYEANPLRFGHGRPQPPKLPDAAWINQPSKEALIQTN